MFLQKKSVCVQTGARQAPGVEVPKELVSSFASLSSTKERLAKLIELGNALPRMRDDDKVLSNQVIGCASQVWMLVTKNEDGIVSISADSDSDISRGLAHVLIQAFGGSTPAEIDIADVGVLEQLQLGPVLDSPSRTNSFRNMFNTLKKRSNALEGNLPQFPSLVIRRNALEPQGSFAEAQAQFLQPDMATVSRLASTFRQKKIGVVAHFYMDPEVQGVLSSAADSWPHIHISGLLFQPSYTKLSGLAASLQVVSRRMAIPPALLGRAVCLCFCGHNCIVLALLLHSPLLLLVAHPARRPMDFSQPR